MPTSRPKKPSTPLLEDVRTDDTPEQEFAAQVKGTNELRKRAGLPPLTTAQIEHFRPVPPPPAPRPPGAPSLKRFITPVGSPGVTVEQALTPAEAAELARLLDAAAAARRAQR